MCRSPLLAILCVLITLASLLYLKDARACENDPPDQDDPVCSPPNETAETGDVGREPPLCAVEAETAQEWELQICAGDPLLPAPTVQGTPASDIFMDPVPPTGPASSPSTAPTSFRSSSNTHPASIPSSQISESTRRVPTLEDSHANQRRVAENTIRVEPFQLRIWKRGAFEPKIHAISITCKNQRRELSHFKVTKYGDKIYWIVFREKPWEISAADGSDCVAEFSITSELDDGGIAMGWGSARLYENVAFDLENALFSRLHESVLTLEECNEGGPRCRNENRRCLSKCRYQFSDPPNRGIHYE